MKRSSLVNKRIAFLATDGFKQVELTEPWNAVRDSAGKPELISLKSDKIQGFNHADKFDVDRTVEAVAAEDYDGPVIPGGVNSPETLHTNETAVDFVRDFIKQGKPDAAICHGPWTLVEADVVNGRKLASWPSLKTEISNAGGFWVDETVVVEDGLVTSRNPDDLPNFCIKAIEEFAEGRHAEQRT